ncbi:MAG: 30S ribosomal protein S16, partial [Myxococcales bacterium]|nr:30S ribosomal protein S16 [Myxococcales bacterium]
MVKIRLSRAGAKKHPYYHLIAIDERKRRDGRPLERLGTYEPGRSDAALTLDLAAVDAWVA